ncbi:MAG: hypothetical protein ACLSIL_07885 [Enterococcus casseliflavus]
MKKLVELEKSEVSTIISALKMEAHQFKQNGLCIGPDGEPCLTTGQARTIDLLPEDMRETARQSTLESNAWQADAYQEMLELISKLENSTILIETRNNKRR